MVTVNSMILRNKLKMTSRNDYCILLPPGLIIYVTVSLLSLCIIAVSMFCYLCYHDFCMVLFKVFYLILQQKYFIPAFTKIHKRTQCHKRGQLFGQKLNNFMKLTFVDCKAIHLISVNSVDFVKNSCYILN